MNSVQFFEGYLGSGQTMPLRSTLVTLKSGHRVLLSPINFTDEQFQQLKDNPPHALVAPNCFHHLYIKKAAENLKVDTVFFAPGLQKKRPDVDWSIPIDPFTWTYQHELALIFIEGAPMMGECVFFHKESKTLIVTDFIFNFTDMPSNFKTLVYKIMGTFNRTACSRLWHIAIKDKNKFKASIQKILEYDFNRIVMSHGKIIETNGKEIFKNCMKERGFL